MELGLSLGDASKPFEFNSLKQQKKKNKRGLCMTLGINSHKLEEEENDVDESSTDEYTALHLNLLPLPHSLSSDNGSWENGSSGNMEASSANSVGSMDLGIYLRNVVPNDVVDDENGLNHTKKLRLSKQQSASLEESFKQNNTLNPKEKVALAKQLNLRPRQVEVWFQNRRARTKLKQTEVDCEYLKRCSETLTEENRRLQKELEELRALKTSNPFHMQLPATTLTMCPACQRLATVTAAAAETSIPFTVNTPQIFPFSQIPSQPNHS